MRTCQFLRHEGPSTNALIDPTTESQAHLYFIMNSFMIRVFATTHLEYGLTLVNRAMGVLRAYVPPPTGWVMCEQLCYACTTYGVGSFLMSTERQVTLQVDEAKCLHIQHCIQRNNVDVDQKTSFAAQPRWFYLTLTKRSKYEQLAQELETYFLPINGQGATQGSGPSTRGNAVDEAGRTSPAGAESRVEGKTSAAAPGAVAGACHSIVPANSITLGGMQQRAQGSQVTAASRAGTSSRVEGTINVTGSPAHAQSGRVNNGGVKRPATEKLGGGFKRVREE
ncbi:hypothetical protein HK104_006296 [Borealophlyctis nickersoniae]|nr:hypothetical protein HK104_006296 [Borealophlyctis nickersoniae]